MELLYFGTAGFLLYERSITLILKRYCSGLSRRLSEVREVLESKIMCFVILRFIKYFIKSSLLDLYIDIECDFYFVQIY